MKDMKINKIGDEKGNVASSSNKTQSIIMKYFGKLTFSKKVLQNREVDKLLDMYENVMEVNNPFLVELKVCATEENTCLTLYWP